MPKKTDRNVIVRAYQLSTQLGLTIDEVTDRFDFAPMADDPALVHQGFQRLIGHGVDPIEVEAVKHLLEGRPTGIHHGTVVSTQFVGDGVRLFDEGGKFQFRIDATLANWTLRVEQLSREEAKLYKSKQP